MMNHLEGLAPLKNRYLLLRHGESHASAMKKIVSSVENGRDKYGQTEIGHLEVRSSVTKAKEAGVFSDGRPILIFSSQFLRTKQAAEDARKVLGVSEEDVLEKQELNERNFGKLEGSSTGNYVPVWQEDKKDPEDTKHEEWGVETVEFVRERATAFIAEIEKIYTGFTVILAGHGDWLQILETAFRGMDPREHRDLQPLQTGELREVFLREQSHQMEGKTFLGGTATL
jgi:broad specificity phosphatase PhoE